MKKTFFSAFVCSLALFVMTGCAEENVVKAPHRGESLESGVLSEESATVENSAPAEESDASREESAPLPEESGDLSEDSSKEPVYRSGPYVYTLTNGVAKLTGYEGDESELTMPSDLDSHPLTAIESGAFKNAGKLKKLTLSDGVVNIAAGALGGCTALECLNIGSGAAVLNVPDLAGCLSLSEIHVQPANAAFSSKDGLLYSKDGTVLKLCPRQLKAEKLSLPKGLERIDENAFAECRGVKAAEVPEGCALSAFSFFHCTSLESIGLPEGLESIPEKCFFGCVRLKEITVPEGVSEIGRLAFFGCVTLKSAKLPQTVSGIGDDAFKCCSSLKKIEVGGEYGKDWYNKVGKQLIADRKT